MSIEAIAAPSVAVLEESIDQSSLSLPNQLSGWMGEKGKYFSELFAQISFIFSRIPGTDAAAFNASNVFFNAGKKVLAGPSAIKGTMKLAEKFFHPVDLKNRLLEGKEKVRNLVGEICYVFGDTVDFLGGLSSNTFKVLPASVKNFVGLKSISLTKDLSAIFGLSNSAYNLSCDIERLKKAGITVVDKKIKDPAKKEAAKQYKESMLEATINNKWWDIQRDVCAVAMCVLGVASTAIGASFSPWVFCALGTAGLVGKALMHFEAQKVGFWKERYAEVIPAK